MNINLTMVNHCIVFGCGNKPNPGAALHEFTLLKTDR